MITRLSFFLALSLLLLGCQSDVAQQPKTAAVAPPPALSTAVMTLPSTASPTAAVTEATSDTDKPTPFPTETATSEPQPEISLEPPTAYPSVPTAVGVPIEYPEPESVAVSEVVWSYRIVNEYPHDTGAFTQGLVIEDNLTTLLEGTGRDSSLRRIDLQSGDVKQYRRLDDDLFGEGITLFGDRIYQLTWRKGTGFIYDSATFEPLARFFYDHEGWGLTHNGSQLIVSDGSDVIRFWDPDTLQEVRRIQVAGEQGPVTKLNELEYVDGEIWANVWLTDVVVRISPDDGRVLGWIDLSGLLSPDLIDGSNAVLNGIAYDEASGRLFVTGKLWPSLFEIEVFPPEGT